MSMMMKSSVGARMAARPARRATAVNAGRELWYPGATAPSYLNGTLPGDRGFDPLSLGSNPETLKYLAEGEITNGRWAMTAVAGILVADLLGRPSFWTAGNETYPLDNQTLGAIEVGVFGVLEGLRYNNYKKTGSLTTFMDPAGMTSEKTRVNEVKNGRLAMLAFLGFCSQAAVTGQGPIDCLKTHLADPAHNNIFTSSVGGESAGFVAILAFWPAIIEATKIRGDDKQTDFFPWSWRQ